jgi:outer membrane protein assembly factor BamB
MRKVLFVVATVVLAVFLPAPAGSAPPPPQWGQDGYGPGHTRYNPDEATINAATIGKLKLRWSVTPAPGEPGCTPPPVAPLVSGGRVFLTDTGGVAAYDLTTGKRLWSAPVFSLIQAPLVVTDGLVVVFDTNCYSTSDYASGVTALNAATGAKVWEKSSNWTIDTAVADTGTVVVSGYCGTCDGSDHGVDAFRIADGAKLWSHENEVLAGPVSAGGRVLLHRTIGGGDTYASPITTGAPTWGTSGTITAAGATPDGRQFYLATGEGLAAVDAATDRLAWQVPTEGGDLAADGRRVYVASAGRVNTYDAANGKLLWTRALTDPRSPVRAGGLLYVLNGAGTLAVLSPVTGQPVVTNNLSTGLTAHVVPAAGRLLTRQGPTVHAYTP